MTTEQKIQLAKDAFNGINEQLYDVILCQHLPADLPDGIYDAPGLSQSDVIATMLAFTDAELAAMEAVGVLPRNDHEDRIAKKQAEIVAYKKNPLARIDVLFQLEFELKQIYAEMLETPFQVVTF